MLQYREPSLQTAIYTPMQALLHVDFWWIQNATDPGRQKNSTASWFTILHYLLKHNKTLLLLLQSNL